METNVLEYEVHCIVIFSARSLGIVTKQSRIGRISSSGVASGKDKEQYWKRIMIIDDDTDILTTFRIGIENSTKRFAVDTYNDPKMALLNFQPNFYDLLLIDVNMPYMNGFQLSERILEMDINVKICFISAGEINHDALREIHPSISLGCFIKKPVTIDYLIDRIMKEID